MQTEQLTDMERIATVFVKVIEDDVKALALLGLLRGDTTQEQVKVFVHALKCDTGLHEKGRAIFARWKDEARVEGDAESIEFLRWSVGYDNLVEPLGCVNEMTDKERGELRQRILSRA